MDSNQRLLLQPGALRPRVARTAATILGKPINRLLGLRALDALYNETSQATGTVSDGAAFLDRALAKLQVRTELSPNLDAVPTTGPLVIVANHPYGGIEGLALVRELMRVRPDIKVMANRLLARVVELDPFSIWVNPFGGAAAHKSNIGAMRDALKYVKSGGALLVFPAGEVAHLKARERFQWSVLDPKWQASIARLITASRASVLPLYIEGRNSNLFQLAGLISPMLRTALLPRELLGRRKSTLQVRVGRALAPEQWERYTDPNQLIGFLRLATYALAGTRGAESTARRAVADGKANDAKARTLDANAAVAVKRDGQAVRAGNVKDMLASGGSVDVLTDKGANSTTACEHGAVTTDAAGANGANGASGANGANSTSDAVDTKGLSSTESADAFSGANESIRGPEANGKHALHFATEPSNGDEDALSLSAAPTREQAPIAAPAPPERIASEVQALAADRKLHASGDFEVYCAYAPEIPTLMHELGRLRELTFRAAGEGTGRALDLDVYDETYRHLFLWHKLEQRIVGAYRLGATDEIMATSGELGLYTRTLFRYNARFIQDLGPALELGRAFVVPDFQKSYLPLMLLWQGIGRFLARHPRYVTLFGPVSISADYSPVSRYVMAKRLLSATTQGRHTKPKAAANRTKAAANKLRAATTRSSTPTGNYRLNQRSIAGVDLESLEALATSSKDLCHLIASIDPTGQGLPVLLRHYLKLNGRVLAFNLDPTFGDALDALLVVDLRDTEPRDLRRILGAEGYAAFAGEHGDPGREPAPEETAA